MPATSRQLLPREQRQSSILDGAAKAFARAGFAATSMEDVAQAAGISKLLLYRHFAGKPELYRRVLERTFDMLVEELHRHLEHNATGATVRSVLAVGRAFPDGLRLLLVHAAREPEFADYAHEVRGQIVSAWLPFMPIEDDVLRRWATELAVAYVWQAVLIWLETGNLTRDAEFHERCTAGLHAMVRGLSDPKSVRPLRPKR